MKNIYKIVLVVNVLLVIISCKKSFLEAKPSTTIVAPSTLSDLQGLLENAVVLNSCTPILSQLACDDYIFNDYESWKATQTITERNSYVWDKNLYGGEVNILDWKKGYSGIFYANNILESLNQIQFNNNNAVQYNLVKGWALFIRAYILYDLVRNFSPNYNRTMASNNLGLPIRLSPAIDALVQRSSVQETYHQILSDLEDSKQLLSSTLPANTNRPSKAAAFALFSRIYISMNDYNKAELYSDSALSITKKLIDYNSVSKTATSPFAVNNDETIFSSTGLFDSYLIAASSSANSGVTINPDLIKLYKADDLRLQIYFATNSVTGKLYSKRRYYPQSVPFTGLATDELYLIKSECLARRNEPDLALKWLNSLLIKRFPPAKFTNLTNEDVSDVLQTVLNERRKELVWRTLRWSDLKRLNTSGANITLSRVLNNVTYTLPPNDPKYVFPIPDDEIALSGINQNLR